MTTKMKNPETGDEIDVPGRRVKDHLLNGYEVVDGTDVSTIDDVPVETGEDQSDDPTKAELYDKAQELDIEGRSKMDKDELEEAVEDAEVEAETGEAPVVEAGTDATSTNMETRAEKGIL